MPGPGSPRPHHCHHPGCSTDPSAAAEGRGGADGLARAQPGWAVTPAPAVPRAGDAGAGTRWPDPHPGRVLLGQPSCCSPPAPPLSSSLTGFAASPALLPPPRHLMLSCPDLRVVVPETRQSTNLSPASCEPSSVSDLWWVSRDTCDTSVWHNLASCTPTHGHGQTSGCCSGPYSSLAACHSHHGSAAGGRPVLPVCTLAGGELLPRHFCLHGLCRATCQEEQPSTNGKPKGTSAGQWDFSLQSSRSLQRSPFPFVPGAF